MLTVERQEDILSHRCVASSPVDRDGDRGDEETIAAGVRRRRHRFFLLRRPGRHRRLALDHRIGRDRLLGDPHRYGLGEGQAHARAAGLGRGGHRDVLVTSRCGRVYFFFTLFFFLFFSSIAFSSPSFCHHAPHRRRYPAEAGGRRRSRPASPGLWRGPLHLWLLPARRRPRDAHVRWEDGREADRGRVPPGKGRCRFEVEGRTTKGHI